MAIGVIVVSTVWLAAGCAGNGEERQPDHARSALTAERLRQLDLTRRIPRQVRAACAEAQRLVSVRVVCPKLIPDIPLAKIEGLWGSITFQGEPRVWEVSFSNAGGFHGRPLVGVEHWIAGGGKTNLVQQWILSDFVHEVKGDAVLVRTLKARGRHVRVYRFPSYPAGGPNGGHWAALVEVGDEVVYASLHGERYIKAAVEMAVDLAVQAERSGSPAGTRR